MDDYYKTLELERAATSDEIRSSYRRLAMKWHPDRNQGSAEAEERFKQISEAYSVLSDDDKRRNYDLYLSGEGQRRDSFGRSYNPGFQGVSPEEAAAMFMNEMCELAAELTLHNVSWKDIAQELVRRGCAENTARDIAREIEKRRKAMIRSRARPYFLRSAVSGALGLAMVGAFAGVGLGILGFIGLLMFLSGAWNLVRAIYYMTTGRTPLIGF
jgi:DnaJ-class molecular chaperone